MKRIMFKHNYRFENLKKNYRAHWSEVYAVVTDSKKIKLGFQKKVKSP